jgi:hypothetical protein
MKWVQFLQGYAQFLLVLTLQAGWISGQFLVMTDSGH